MTLLQKKNISPLPTMGDMLFLVVLLFPLRLLPDYLFGDGSTGWHLAAGDFTIRNLSVPHQDFISYTFNGKAWVVLYWLADVVMSFVNQVAGLNGLALLISTAIAWLFLSLYAKCRQAGCHFILSALFVLIAAIASTVHWHARPHIMTFIGVYVFATTLEAFHRKIISSKHLIITITVAMLIWVNSHPGFVIGYMCLLIYLGIAVVSLCVSPKGQEKQALIQEAKVLGLALMLSAVVSVVNPYGLELHYNVASYLGQSQIVNSVEEYLSPVFHGSLQSTCLELLFYLLIFGLVVSNKRPSMPQAFMCIAFAHLTLSAMRNIPLFAIVVLPVIGELFSKTTIAESLEKRIADMPVPLPQLKKRWDHLGAVFNQMESKCKMHILPVSVVIVLGIAACNQGKLFGYSLLNCGFSPDRFPTSTLTYISKNKLPPYQGLNQVNWGGYIYYKLGIPVFIDDRASFFGEAFYLQYGKLVSLYPEWSDILNKYHISWIIFPKKSDLAERLKSAPNWRIAAEDQAAYVFCKSEKD